MYKTSVYTPVNGNIEELDIENSKIHKRWYCPHYTDYVSTCCWI